MSKEDRTRPFWVKVRDNWVQYHDHRDGVCDIWGEQPTKENCSFRAGKCYFTYKYGDKHLWCSCSLCNMGMPEEIRRRRREGKRATRNWWKEYE